MATLKIKVPSSSLPAQVIVDQNSPIQLTAETTQIDVSVGTHTLAFTTANDHSFTTQVDVPEGCLEYIIPTSLKRTYDGDPNYQINMCWFVYDDPTHSLIGELSDPNGIFDLLKDTSDPSYTQFNITVKEAQESSIEYQTIYFGELIVKNASGKVVSKEGFTYCRKQGPFLNVGDTESLEKTLYPGTGNINNEISSMYVHMKGGTYDGSYGSEIKVTLPGGSIDNSTGYAYVKVGNALSHALGSTPYAFYEPTHIIMFLSFHRSDLFDGYFTLRLMDSNLNPIKDLQLPSSGISDSRILRMMIMHPLKIYDSDIYMGFAVTLEDESTDYSSDAPYVRLEAIEYKTARDMKIYLD